MSEVYEIEKVALQSKQPDRGYTLKCHYLKEPHSRNALCELALEGKIIRRFLFPAYKVWNLAAHFSDIVDGEIEKSSRGYEMAAWDGISGATVMTPKEKEAEE